MAKYPVKRGSRYDKWLIPLIHDWVLEGAQLLDGGDAEEISKRSPDFGVIFQTGDDSVYQYARMTVYLKSKNGAAVKLKNADGEFFELPDPKASPTDHAKSYIEWLGMDEETIEEISAQIDEINKPLAPRHILPVEQLTDEEKNDPN